MLKRWQKNQLTEIRYIGAAAANMLPLRNRKPAGQNQIQQNEIQNNTNDSVPTAAQPLN